MYSVPIPYGQRQAIGDPVHTANRRCHPGNRVATATPATPWLKEGNGLFLQKQELSMSTLNDVCLSDLELDMVSGGVKIQLGGLGFDIGESHIAFGIYINGVGGVAIINNGSACGTLKGVGGGCV